MSDEQTNFKVTDRRLFNADGTPRDIPPEERVEKKVQDSVAPAPATPAPHIAAEEPPALDTKAAREESELPDVNDPASFVNFVMSIASNAASALGMMEHPVTHERDVDLELAKHWLDVLGMLQNKTRGNLAPQESQILEGLLADLRMQYVSLNNASTAKGARAFSGRDITGGK